MERFEALSRIVVAVSILQLVLAVSIDLGLLAILLLLVPLFSLLQEVVVLLGTKDKAHVSLLLVVLALLKDDGAVLAVDVLPDL